MISGISWTVLAVEESKVLVLADKTVAEKPYNKTCKEVTWETCTLRKWLNEDFYNKFSEKEKGMIVEVNNTNPENDLSGVKGGNDTKDRIFVFSLDDMEHYYWGVVIGRTDNFGEYWRLRTPGKELRQALVVNPDGSILDDDECWVEFAYGIRPAMWIKKMC